MCGLPFAGKSTLARAIAAAQGRTLIEVDRLVARDGVPPGEPIPDRHWSVAYRAAEAALRDALAAGDAVVYDGVNFRWAQREKLRRVARGAGAAVLIVHVTTPMPDNLRRQRVNLAHPVRPAIDPATFAMVRDRFEPPRPGEWSVGYDGSEPVGSWLDRVVATLVAP